MINNKKLMTIEEAYLKYLPDFFAGEKYKWIAVQHFQKHWNIEATDFAGMLDQSLGKTYNLLASGYYYARAMIVGFAKEDPEGVRELFRMLYDETRDLTERAEKFIAYAEDRKQNHNEEDWKNHYQDTRSISVYLWLRYPDKYYIYKYGEIRPAAEELESDFLPKKVATVDNLIGGYRFCDEICAQISKNDAITSTFRGLLTDDCYPDPQYRTLTMDVVFYISRYYLQKGDETEEIDISDPLFTDGLWGPSPDVYTPGFLKEDWLKLLNNPEIIGPVWGGTLAAFYDAGGQGTCTQIGQTFGKSAMAISGYCTNLAKRIHKVTGCPLAIRKNGKTMYWPILFLGRPADSGTPGSFIWRLRDELMEALGEFGIERYLWDKPVAQDDGIRIWKISEGKDSTGLPEDVKAGLLGRKAVSIHGTTKAIGMTQVSQGENFLHGIQKGDYFYLCFASNIQLLGQFTEEVATPSPDIDERMGEEGWYERVYQLIAEPVRTEPMQGNPNGGHRTEIRLVSKYRLRNMVYLKNLF